MGTYTSIWKWESGFEMPHKGYTIHESMAFDPFGVVAKQYSVLGKSFSSLAAAKSYVDQYIEEQKSQRTQDNYATPLPTPTGSSEEPQDYATKIMDKAVTAGLEHQKWVEDKQQGLLDTFGQRLEELQKKPTGQEVGNLMEAGTAEIMRTQQQATHSALGALAARGLLGSSASESAVAKIAGETAGKVGLLASQTTSSLLKTRALQETELEKAMASVLNIPALQGYQQLTQAGAAAATFATPTVMPPTDFTF